MRRVVSITVLLSLLFTFIVQSNVFAARKVPDFIGIACGNGVFVTIDNGNSIAVSMNCTSWTYAIRDSKAYKFNKVIRGKNEFMILAEDLNDNTSSIILKSRNGFKWDIVQDNDTKTNIRSIAWTGNKYIALGYKVILTSDDGTEWARQDIESDACLNDAIYDGKQFIAVGSSNGSGCILKSTDGVVWSECYELMKDQEKDSFYKIIYTGEYYLIKTTMGYTFYSEDLVHGQKIAVDYLYGQPCSLNDIAYNGNTFVAVTDKGGIYTSKDGQNWTLRKVKKIDDYDLKTVRYTNGKFLMIGNSKNSSIMLTSMNGINWCVSKIAAASK
ncbi:MAG TPA: hypothetical protein VF941_04695 [Clostridia bacterium]